MPPRPALQRLLSRPESLDFLRLLVGTPTSARTENGAPRTKKCRRGISTLQPSSILKRTGILGRKEGKAHVRACAERRKYSSAAAAVPALKKFEEEEDNHAQALPASKIQQLREALQKQELEDLPINTAKKQAHRKDDGLFEAPLRFFINPPTSKSSKPNKRSASKVVPHPSLPQDRQALEDAWQTQDWTAEQLSLLAHPKAETNILNPFKTVELQYLPLSHWADLLGSRRRTHGPEGNRIIWQAFLYSKRVIPTEGDLAGRIWMGFLSLGFEDQAVLAELVEYAENQWITEKKRWEKLYTTIVGHFLLEGSTQEVEHWHKVLIVNHLPHRRWMFTEMCLGVIVKRGNLEPVKLIYPDHKRRSKRLSIYNTIIPAFCALEDYKSALDWHFFLLAAGDVPTALRLIEPLVSYLAVYEPENAEKVTKSLVDAGVDFGPKLGTKLQSTTVISREMMNLIHGQTLKITPKEYNDGLGARWFATTWVSLDLAINSIHALGVSEIGPLSLQAIALREDPPSLLLRIEQLRNLGISIGNSLFSRAVESFARRGQYNHLEGLLKSDQHPAELEKAELQEDLLAEYSRVGDWAAYRRTVAIRSLAAITPEKEVHNIILRNIARQGDVNLLLNYIRDMRISDPSIPIYGKTTAWMLRCLLVPRRDGHRPITARGANNRGPKNDINQAIKLLRTIMKSGYYVPILAWQEIVRRCGMLGRTDTLSDICTFLASWYGPINEEKVYRRHNYRTPVQIPTKHELHPLRMLFSKSLIIAIVEWGFIHALRNKPHHGSIADPTVWVDPRSTPLPDITSGLRLLKELNRLGVYVDGKYVSKALMNRLYTYYGPGTSEKIYNRVARKKVKGRLEEIAAQIDGVLDGSYLTGVNLGDLVDRLAKLRWKKVVHKRRRHGRTRDPRLYAD